MQAGLNEGRGVGLVWVRVSDSNNRIIEKIFEQSNSSSEYYTTVSTERKHMHSRKPPNWGNSNQRWNRYRSLAGADRFHLWLERINIEKEI